MPTKITLKDRVEWRDSKGRLSRQNGLAIEFNDGTKHWYLKGKRHRKNGPAVEGTTLFYYKMGKFLIPT